MRRLLPYIIIVLISMLLYTLLLYFQGYDNEITNSTYYIILKAVSILFFWIGAIKFILRLNWYGPLGGFLVPVFWYLLGTCYFCGHHQGSELYCKLRRNEGYYIIPAIKKDFTMFCEFGWKYKFLLGKKLLYAYKTEFLPDSDTILVGVMKEARLFKEFTLKKNPTHEEIEHAKQGWYMEGDIEKPFNKYSYMFFQAIYYKRDSIERENNKPKSRWDKLEQNKK